MKKHLSVVVLSMAAAAAQAQQTEAAAPAEAQQVVEVSAIKDPQLKPYRQMLKGVDAFEEHRRLAPQAPLLFELRAPGGEEAATDGMVLRIAGDHVSVPLPLGEGGTFTIPRSQAALDDDADIILNRKKNQAFWRPHIRTPGVPANARRMGDLRLECEMSWAILKQEFPMVYRGALGVVGGMCKAPMVGLHYTAPKPVKSVTLVSGERRQPLRVDKNGRGFVPPLQDRSWDDDSLFVYEFAEQPVAAGATAAP